MTHPKRPNQALERTAHPLRIHFRPRSLSVAVAHLGLVRSMPAAVIESHDYTQLIDCDFTVTDADNSTFAAYLPRTGTAVRQIAVQDWGSDWLVLQLHDAFEYQLGSLDTGFLAVDITHLIVRSRWIGHPIGPQRTSVFVLLDPDHLLDSNQQFRSADFIHITWAMIQPY